MFSIALLCRPHGPLTTYPKRVQLTIGAYLGFSADFLVCSRYSLSDRITTRGRLTSGAQSKIFSRCLHLSKILRLFIGFIGRFRLCFVCKKTSCLSFSSSPRICTATNFELRSLSLLFLCQLRHKVLRSPSSLRVVTRSLSIVLIVELLSKNALTTALLPGEFCGLLQMIK